MTESTSTPERMSFHRNSQVSGVEVLTFHDTKVAWCCYSSDFEFVAPSSWHGEIRHRRKTTLVEPGDVLCARPGEVFSGLPALIQGSGSSLMVEPKALTDYLAEHEVRPEKLELLAHARMSSELGARLTDVFRAFHTECRALEIESALVEFFALALPELAGRETNRRVDARSESMAAARLHACLEQDCSESIELETLAREVGLSRFRTLRLFKRHFGLPPHAYHLRMRLGIAQRSLRSGRPPAEVAAECGFADQSHLTRHFKRLYHLTPAEYARIGDTPASGAASHPLQ